MNKSELIADLTSKVKEVLNTKCLETFGDVKLYQSNVFTSGQDSNGQPISQKRNVNFYVYKEGQGEDEEAGYKDSDFTNPEDKNPTGSTLNIINGIYRNNALRNRVIGVICKQVRARLAASPSNDELYLCKLCLQNLDQMTNAFMEYVASNGTIQANGGTASDSDLEYVVMTEAWAKVADAVSVDVTFPA